ncbi:TetR/AcrR family transcriptional regulator [Curtobacterium aurantiacum]|uniref:TetR/AcrR family transcriptional regulator n=1 Tax=Curtobacterium aurantiacum TaxID=3236919 RepID=A0ABS5VCF7_9MICO|nr:TetR/AcrR family transcriptional regulator [Curtobacterium flaccumfaciens]MBT1545644.1 TetR/AcrR family transcriptional regulator [Curtobacterium flaccumfaciens pv. flaccumfaciens]MBT1586500.1 TetR/AcrR family transcriptional regulator [Curtobacterium flaccumfaciens pv. flaccumfaciens]
MVSRAESAAITRRSLLDAARSLLDEGGPQRVTLREVGNRAQVSRGAAYRHFADKESLLAAVGAESWDRIAEELAQIGAGGHRSSEAILRAALEALMTVAKDEPEVYRMMFTLPANDPDEAIAAAARAQAEFLAIVGDVVGTERAHLYGAMLLTSAHGIASMDASGHLSPQMWQTTPDEVVAALVQLVAERP